MLGIELGLNQLFAKMEGEFKMKMLPIALKAEPAKHQNGSSTYMSVRSQTPAITRRAPMLQPILMPNLSKIRLAGKAKIGWTIGKSKVLRVTITAEKWNFYSTLLLMLEKVWVGSELTRAANI